MEFIAILVIASRSRQPEFGHLSAEQDSAPTVVVDDPVDKS